MAAPRSVRARVAGIAAAPDSGAAAVEAFARRHRLRPYEALPWLAALAAYFLFPGYLPLAGQILATTLFALSADLVLGYAGIVTLGQAAFFGAGAYTAGLLAAHGWGEPITGLLAAAVTAAATGFLSGLVILRSTGLSLLMQTLVVAAMLGEAANKASAITGGDDGLQGMQVWPLFGHFEFGLYGRTAFFYCLAVLFLCWLAVRRIVHSGFGRSLTGIRENVGRMHAIGAPVMRRRLVAYTISAALAGISGALVAQTTGFVGLDSLGLERSGTVLIMLIIGGVGRLYGAFIGVPLYMVAQDRFSSIEPVYWYFWIGLLMVAARDLRPRRGARPGRPAADLGRKAAMRLPALETRGLSKSFGALTVANAIDFRLDPGARHALIGPNGAGKTSFVNLVTGVLPPSAGRIFVNGADVTALPQAARVKRGLVRTFQITQLCPRLNVIENVTLAVCERRGLGGNLWRPAGRHRAAIEEAYALLEQMGLAEEALRPVATLAYGQQRLTEIAVALGLAPNVLLLDEPAAGVPSGESGRIIDAIEQLPAEIALLIIDHDMDLVFRLARRITVLVQGQVLVEGPPAEIAADPRVRRVYLGERAAR